MVKYLRNTNYETTNYLIHYGRSKKDGAPGVGTGNWRRGGGRSQSAVRQEYYRIRKEERSGIYDRNKHQGSYHYTGTRLDYKWQEVINASNLDGPINVAGQIAKDENFLKQVSNDESFDDIRKSVNAYWGAPGTTNNCKKCTMAQEIRRRGYDVAAGRSFDGASSAATSYWFDGAVQYRETNLDSFADRLTKVFGNNGRGEVTFTYPEGGGHSVYAYRDGSGYTISDGQSNDKFTGSSWRETMKKVEKAYGLSGPGKYTCTRLDTATPNWKHLEQDSVLRVVYDDSSKNQIYNKTDKVYGVMLDTRLGNVSNESREMQLDVSESEDVFGFNSFKKPWEFGDNYYRFRYKRG